jgi:transcriptional regulator with XRE-family HTH domain
MDDARLGRTVRVLRQRRGLRQRDLSARCGVSKSAISHIERGHADRYTIATVRRVMKALDATAELHATWGGAGDLDRLLDADHARLVGAWAERHRRAGWETWPEASYSIYGERGRIDLLAYHPPTATLEVAECKTGIWNVQDTVGRLDAKVRLGPVVAAGRGWQVRRTIGALVIAEGRTARRRIAQHHELFHRYDARGHRADAFIGDPTHAAGGLLTFVSLPRSNQRSLRRAGQRRVRVPSVEEAPNAPSRRQRPSRGWTLAKRTE